MDCERKNTGMTWFTHVLFTKYVSPLSSVYCKAVYRWTRQQGDGRHTSDGEKPGFTQMHELSARTHRRSRVQDIKCSQ